MVENIAAGQPTEVAVFDVWINSEGHCKNIMSANYKEMAQQKMVNIRPSSSAGNN